MDNNELHRGLSARQIRMIALGGTIGVGLFMGQLVQLNGLVHQLFCVLNCRYLFILNHESNGRNDLFKSNYWIFSQHLQVITFTLLQVI